MKPARRKPTEAEWLRHKATIKRLYIFDDMPLVQLVAELESLGLFVTKAQLEYQLKKWKFRKNIDKTTWVSIDHKISKRKREGKESQVIYCGKRVKLSTIEKETNRHRDMTIFSQLANPPSSPSPSVLSDMHVAVCTPQPLPMEFTWPETLPWIRFQATNLLPMLSSFRLEESLEDRGIQLLHPERSRRFISTIVTPDLQPDSMVPQCSVSKLATAIGKSMPESYPDEHLRRAQALLSGRSQEVLPECMAIAIYKISNNHIDLFDSAEFSATFDSLEECGILNLQIDLGAIGDMTIRAFVERLFSGATYHLSPFGARVLGEKPEAVLRWLMSSGQSPNVLVRTPDWWSTPLLAAIQTKNLRLVEHLLDVGTDANLSKPDHPQSPLELGLQCHEFGYVVTSRIVELLLGHGAITDWDFALHLAIRARDTNLAMTIFHRGANLHRTYKPEGNFPYKESALSVASAVGKLETKFILDLLASEIPSKSAADFVTADVLISAALAAKNDIIHFLYDIAATSSLTVALRTNTASHH